MKNIARVFWLYGRSGAGKTTLARRLQTGFQGRKIPVFMLDGDDTRGGLCSDLGFTSEARLENHRRIAEIARLAVEQGLNVVVATMAPEHKQRDIVKNVLGGHLTWIYIHAPLDTCIQRDPKGLYRRAGEGRVKGLLDYPFDAPRPGECENVVDTVARDEEGCCQSILELARKELAGFAG